MNPEIQCRIDFIKNHCINFTVAEIAQAIGNPSVIHEANLYNLQQRKGSLGRTTEIILLGEVGNNTATPDLGTIELKTIHATRYEKTYKFKENLRITKINFNKIQTEEFEKSSLRTKTNILLFVYEQKYKQSIQDTKLLDVLSLDITKLYYSELESDYNYVKEKCKSGTANALTSAKSQPNKIAKTYSSGSSITCLKYKASDTGIECEAKPKGFYIFKDTLQKIVTELNK